MEENAFVTKLLPDTSRNRKDSSFTEHLFQRGMPKLKPLSYSYCTYISLICDFTETSFVSLSVFF